MTGLYVQLDTNWPDHPKIIAAGLDGAGLHAIALCVAKRLGYDGVLHRAHLLRLGGTPEVIDRLVEIGLLDPVDNDRVAVHDWLDRNPSRVGYRGRVGGESGATGRRLAPDPSGDGRRGNHLRWNHPGDLDTCPICFGADAQVSRGESGRVSGGESGRVSGASRVGYRVGSLDIDIDRDRDKGGDPTNHGPSATGPPPRRCAEHRDYPEDAHIPPCGRCADARRAADAWATAHPGPGPDRFDHRLDDQQAAGLAKAEANVRALDRTPPDPALNIAGVAQARAATRPVPQEAPE
jgi:hypothetical protein